MLNQFLSAALATILGFFLYAVMLLCYRLLFTRSYDDYPIKYYGKKKQRKVKGPKDIIPADPYSEIIDHYPTYHRHDGVK